MKILFLTREYPPETLWGGPAISYCNLAEGLARLGHEVHVITQAVGKQRDYLQNGVWIHRVGSDSRRYSTIARLDYMLFAWLRYLRLAREGKIEVVDAPYWSAEGIILGLRREIPLVVSLQSSAETSLQMDQGLPINQALSLRFLGLIARVVAKRADWLVANSKKTYDQAMQQGFDRERISIVYHSVNPVDPKATSSNARNLMGISEGTKIVLYVGRLEPRKGFDLLCSTAKDLEMYAPECVLVFIGRDTLSGGRGDSYKARVLSNLYQNHVPKNLIFKEYLDDKDLSSIYEACSVFVSPSRSESFGITIIEALSHGKPVVVTRTGIAAELDLRPPFGFVVPVNNTFQITQAVLAALALSEEELVQVSYANRRTALRFSSSQILAQALFAYKKAIEIKRGTTLT